MGVSTSPAVTIQPEVYDHLRRFGAEASLPTACDLVRECFPELRRLEVRLLDDPDEDGRAWVVLDAVLPASYTEDAARSQRRRFDELALERLPRERVPSFSYSLHIEPE